MNQPRQTEKLLKVKNLSVGFDTLFGYASAVRDVSFELKEKEVLGIVGESGSGKSVTALSILGLIKTPPGSVESGSIIFDKMDLLQLRKKQMRRIRGNRIAMIFQEPMTSLNPLFSIGSQIAEMYLHHQGLSRSQANAQAVDMLARVGIPSPHNRAKDFPHQLSGGMLQRSMIAMALSCKPEVLIADEPTTALDVTIQAQVMDLIVSLKKDVETSVIMITHDLGLIAETAQRVIVMYAGQVVEEAAVLSLFDTPLHPYTRALIKAIPAKFTQKKSNKYRLKEIKGTVPSSFALPDGCSFYDRCDVSKPECRTWKTVLIANQENHKVRCIHYV